jgi:HD-GYP domain-containing protein (c-di-GMP phosphodiesterase class II)
LLSLTLAAVVSLSFCLTIYFLKRKEKIYIEELKQTTEQLQQNIIAIDTFMLSLTSIHHFSLGITTFKSREGLSQNIIDSASKLFNFETGSVMLLNPDTNQLEITASKGLSPEIVSKTHLRIGQGVAGKVVKTGKPIFIEDVATDPRFLRTDKIHYPSKSLISLPMEVNKKIIGALNISPSQKKDVYDDKIMHLLSTFADQCAIALETITLYHNLQKSYLEIIKTLTRVSDLKDSYSYSHAGRANKLAYFICEKLKLPKNISRQIEYAALIHDVGKIGIDRQILDKPSTLEKTEREHIEKHPTIASNLIAPIPFLSSIVPTILYHQEWYNGRGYPEGLKGEEIPLGARIVAVIDAYDAMTSDRPYRNKMSKEAAVQELKKCSGTQFDPYIVDTFLEIIEKNSSNKKTS